MLFIEVSQSAKFCTYRIFGALDQSHSVLYQPFLLPKWFSHWGIILAKGQLAIHYDSAPSSRRSCFANPNLNIIYLVTFLWCNFSNTLTLKDMYLKFLFILEIWNYPKENNNMIDDIEMNINHQKAYFWLLCYQRKIIGLRYL